MRDPDRFDWRRPKDYVWLVLGMVYFIMLPFIWIVQLMGNVDTTHRTSRRRAHRPPGISKRLKPTRIKQPKPRVIPPPRIPKIRPTISVSKRWVKSLGRYQTTHYNRATKRRTTYPKVSEMIPKK